mgnify:CR=1 FL=1
MKIAVGNDHAGPEYKKEIVDFLIGAGYSVINHGTNDIESVDYPDYAHQLANSIKKK